MRARETVPAARRNTHGDVSGTKGAASVPPPAVLSRDNIAECTIFIVQNVQRQDVSPLVDLWVSTPMQGAMVQTQLPADESDE